MTRLDALVAALPKILPVVEPIADEMFRDRVFDALVQAAIDDASTGSTGAVYGSRISGEASCGGGAVLHDAVGPSNPQVDLVTAAGREPYVAAVANEVTWQQGATVSAGRPTVIADDGTVTGPGMVASPNIRWDGGTGYVDVPAGPPPSATPTYDGLANQRP